MKTNKLQKSILLIILSLILGGISHAQTLEEILNKHYKTVGLEFLNTVTTIQYKGTKVNHFLKKNSSKVEEGLLNTKFNLTIEKQNGYLLQEFNAYGERNTGYYDGQYWYKNPGSLPEKWPPIFLDRLIIQLALDIEGFFYNRENKGFQVSKLDDVKLKGKQHYMLMLSTPEEDTLFYYINAKTNLITKLSFKGALSDSKEYPSYTFSNYKNIDEIYFPFKWILRSEMLDGSYGNRETIIKEITLNPKVDKRIFDLNHRINNAKN